jgi:hypothetical protein
MIIPEQPVYKGDCKLPLCYLTVPALAAFLSACLFVSGCTESQAPPDNANANANIERTSTQTANNTMTNTPPEPINQETLTRRLKERVKQAREDTFTPPEWETNTWLSVKLGVFYDNSEDFVKDAVCGATKAVLEPNNLRMKKESERALRNKVSAATKCKDAILAMVRAAQDSEPINMVP